MSGCVGGSAPNAKIIIIIIIKTIWFFYVMMLCFMYVMFV